MRREFRRVAIVNRGEAAMRFVHAARELSFQGMPLSSLALYTDPDCHAPFVREADEAFSLGTATFVDPRDGQRKNRYLDYGRLQQALAEARADAVWVGWGFVAEHASFVDLCDRLGLVFIGPSGDVMRRLGDKITSKRLAERARVPVLPWSGGPVETVDEARGVAAASLGYPLLIKATAGGGGRGIRRVREEDELADAFQRARTEALKAFGDPTVFLERCVEGARHVEVQIVGDDAGTIWPVGVRDCTLQRRNQKVVEESPSPALTVDLDRALREAAVRLGREAGYQNAGTVEFLFEPATSQFWFMEVNARLQVEHPVTEMTTGLDLVHLQIALARGERLGDAPPPSRGHAIEVRLNAEDPDAGFAPAPGVVETFRIPGGPGIRVDAGVGEGDVVPQEFDSMIAKVIAWGRDRPEALARLRRALAQSTVVIRDGTTNKAFLADLLARPAVAEGSYDIGWLDRMVACENLRPAGHAEVALLRAAIEAYDAELDVERAQFFDSAARGRPQARPDVGRVVELGFAGHTYKLGVCRMGPADYVVEADGHHLEIHVDQLGRAPLRERRAQGTDWRMRIGDHSFRTLLVVQGLRYLIDVNGVSHRVSRDNAGIVRSSAPALVVSVNVKEGDRIEAGDRLLVLEAMKMEVAVTAPFAGKVREVRVDANVQVGASAPLVVLEPLEADQSGAAEERVRFDGLVASPGHGEDPRARRHHAHGRMRALVLGYDVDAAALKRMLQDSGAPCADGGDDDAALRCECDVLGMFVDIWSLVRPSPADRDLNEHPTLSAEEYLFTYLRTLDASADRLPSTFLDPLQRVLRHFGVTSLERSDPLLESLFRIFKARERADAMVGAMLAILERRLGLPRDLPPRLAGDFRAVLDRLVAVTQQRYPSLNDLAREVRYRYFEGPLLERAREAVYGSAREDLERLVRDPHGPDRQTLVARLVDCPQPLASLLMSLSGEASADARQVMLEVLTRRYYRIRDLRNVRTIAIDGWMFTLIEYDHEGRHIHGITTHAALDACAQVLERARAMLTGFPERDDIVLDLYVWRDGPLGDAGRNAAALRATLDGAGLPRLLRRVVVVVSGPQAGLGLGGMQHFTFRPTPEGYVEEMFYRGAHPMMAKRLNLPILANFVTERLPSPEDVYVLHATAKDNPRDERLYAVAEVRDLTPVRDAAGRVVLLPQLERMFMEAVGGLRRYQAHRPPDRRLQWNRVLLYVWPPFLLRSDEIDALAARMAPATEGLGIEEVMVRARMPRRAASELEDTVIVIANPDTALTISYRSPATEPMPTLTPYEQKVVRSRQQGVVYPYELLKTITPPRDRTQRGSHDFPPGEFFEYDLDDHQRLVAVARPLGANTSNIVVGVIRHFTRKYPDGITRVILLGDPSRDLGALAEAECRRIIAALDLAETKKVPLEWFALSAGARISMESGTENMDWIALVLRRIVNFTQNGGEINIIVNGINVGAQPYWNAEATMLMHTRGILVMMPDSAMVLTGKRALDYSGGVSAEDNRGIGGYERIMGPNGEAQYFASDITEAVRILLRHYEYTHLAPGELFPRRIATSDPVDRDVRSYPYGQDTSGFACVGDIFSDEKNPGRKRPFDIRRVMRAVIDQDDSPLERWAGWRDAETAVVWDAHLGGHPVALLGIESRPIQRLGFVPADGPDQWTAGTLFPQSSRKLARAINAASGNRPVIVLANLTGFDGSPESLRQWQLEYGAEIGRAVVNFRGPMIFCVISRYHGGAFVVFSNALNANLEVTALEGTYASVIGGAPAAAVVFAREVEKRSAEADEIQAIDRQIAQAAGPDRARLRARRTELLRGVRATKLGEVAEEFDHVHSVHRARRVGSVHDIIPPERLRPYLVDAVERGIRRELARLGRERQPEMVPA